MEDKGQMMAGGSQMLPNGDSSPLVATTAKSRHAPPPSGGGPPGEEDAVPSGSALPDDVLADVLRLLPPRGLAVSRCVCKAWRAAVDGRRLLRADLLPRSVRGLLLQYHGLDRPTFLSRPSTDDVDILVGASPNPFGWRNWVTVLDHCNGLLLLKDPSGLLVSNPATRRWAHLPPPPRFHLFLRARGLARLVFEPADSPHYQVVLVPESRSMEEMGKQLWHPVDEGMPSQVWPPSTWILCVFSSLTGKWEERSFGREGDEPLEAASDKEDSVWLWGGCGSYWHGALYARCHTGTSSVLRISLSKDTFQVLKVPTKFELEECAYVYLGKSDKGVCCATIHDWYLFRVWVLDESCGQIEWVLKHHIHLGHTVSRVRNYDQRIEGPWMLQDFNNSEDYGQEILHQDEGESSSRLTKQKLEWDSDNDNVLDNECEVRFGGFVTCLGFHPFKPIVFLNISLRKVAAYHLNTSKVQVLGNVCPEYYEDRRGAHIISSFSYTPCLLEEFPGNKFEGPTKDQVRCGSGW